MMANRTYTKVPQKTLAKIATLLGLIRPKDFDQFHDVMGYVYIETHGSLEGCWLLNEWAQNGGEEIPKGDELKSCWDVYDVDEERYFGMGGLVKLATHSKRKA
ncbi:MAG: hypothetical protein NTX56_04620 [Proteobacteria bacterium]|nr:hypothetical protein [Pseudomonadota bacterium]